MRPTGEEISFHISCSCPENLLVTFTVMGCFPTQELHNMMINNREELTIKSLYTPDTTGLLRVWDVGVERECRSTVRIVRWEVVCNDEADDVCISSLNICLK